MLPSGVYEIHVNLTINPDWFVDLSVKPEHLKRYPSNADSGVFERIKNGDLDMASYPFFTDAEEDSLVEPVPESKSSSIESEVAKESSLALVNLDGVEVVSYFVQYVKTRVTAIREELANNFVDERMFDRFTDILDTPSRKATTIVGFDSGKSITFEKHSLKELDILTRLTSTSDLFPVLYDLKVVSTSPEEVV